MPFSSSRHKFCFCFHFTIKEHPKAWCCSWKDYFSKPQQKNPQSYYYDLETYYYDQTLDHFNYNPQSYLTFPHRYALNFKHWGGGRAMAAPILAYLGEESSLDMMTLVALDGLLIMLIDLKPYKFTQSIGSMENQYLLYQAKMP